MSLAEVESQNGRPKTMEGERPLATRLPRIENLRGNRRSTARDCGEDEYQVAESVLAVRSGTISGVNHVQLYLTLVLLGFVAVVYR